ncbi:MAG TPA: CoA pyrophosphatase [Acetobacteraceae bacterium]|nr:CoA pyrophosphatase [Acetobacteraceae bacterium]
MDAAELRRRLIGVLRSETPGRLVRGNELLAAVTQAPVSAAVLVGFVLGATPSVLLTKRNEHLKRHAGQVSFPGGRLDATDTDAAAAALREAQEEIALDPAQVEVLGHLGDFLTGTGFRITPVVGLIPSGLSFEPAPDEVDAVFEFPIAVLLDPGAPKRERQERNGIARDVWVWPHPEHYIWGATAAILVHLAERLRAEA